MIWVSYINLQTTSNLTTTIAPSVASVMTLPALRARKLRQLVSQNVDVIGPRPTIRPFLQAIERPSAQGPSGGGLPLGPTSLSTILPPCEPSRRWQHVQPLGCLRTQCSMTGSLASHPPTIVSSPAPASHPYSSRHPSTMRFLMAIFSLLCPLIAVASFSPRVYRVALSALSVGYPSVAISWLSSAIRMTVKRL